MAQRLVRLLCRDCRAAYEAGPAEREILGLGAAEPALTLYRPTGCERCNFSGYRGRTGIYELIEIDDELRTMIYRGASEQEMLAYARPHYAGIESDGRRRVQQGDTSLEEVLRVTSVA
jgi:general secretion pathway protein E